MSNAIKRRELMSDTHFTIEKPSHARSHHAMPAAVACGMPTT
jgi:hypothetical protein